MKISGPKKRKKQGSCKKQGFYCKRPNLWALISLVFLIFFGVLFKVYSLSELKSNNQSELDNIQSFVVFQENTLASLSNPNNPPLKATEKLRVVITAYSSTPCQTDDSPYITAAGTFVKEGIVANNFLPFGTKIRIPEIYDDKVFIVEDRMSWKKGNYHIDIWFSEYSQALAFGAKRTYIEILER